MSERKIIQGAKKLQGLVKEQAAKIAELESELETATAILTDSATLHMNILRGKVPLSRAAALHIASAADYDSLKGKVVKLESENFAQSDLIEKLENEIKSLEDDREYNASLVSERDIEIAELRAEVAKLEAEVERLKIENARLSVNPGKNLFGL